MKRASSLCLRNVRDRQHAGSDGRFLYGKIPRAYTVAGARHYTQSTSKPYWSFAHTEKDRSSRIDCRFLGSNPQGVRSSGRGDYPALGHASGPRERNFLNGQKIVCPGFQLSVDHLLKLSSEGSIPSGSGTGCRAVPVISPLCRL